MRFSNPNMLLRICQGDAFAMAVEYLDQKGSAGHIENVLRFERYFAHQDFPQHQAGCYTDDGQMSVAVVEALLKTDNPSVQMFAKCFFHAYKRDPRVGYSRGLQEILDSSNSAVEMISRIHPNSDKNGGAMRSVPIGVLSTPAQVLEIAARQASITHNTPAGILAAEAVALMSHFVLYEADGFERITEYCLDHLPACERFRSAWSGSVVGPDVGMRTVHAVHTLLTTKHGLLPMLEQVIAWGGDTDTVAAIAWGIASARFSGMELPSFFETDLEKDKKHGPAFLKQLGKSLMDKYRR
jgi:ADP-ribosylglycohydrolase